MQNYTFSMIYPRKINTFSTLRYVKTYTFSMISYEYNTQRAPSPPKTIVCQLFVFSCIRWLFCNLVEEDIFYHKFVLQQFESSFPVHAPLNCFQLVDESFCNAVGNIESDSISYSLEISFNTYNKCL